jgi:hypothetical protein
MSKVKVDLKTAIEFAANGFEIECYVLPGSLNKRPSSRHSQVPKDAKIALSLEGKPPCKGKSQVYWEKLKKKLWEKDPTAVYNRAHIDTEIKKLGAYSSLFAHLINQHKVIRVVLK